LHGAKSLKTKDLKTTNCDVQQKVEAILKREEKKD